MKVYHASVIDKATGLEMVAEDCSYNSACYYLERRGAEVIRTYTKGDLTKIFTTGRTFVYDEDRGLLLGE